MERAPAPESVRSSLDLSLIIVSWNTRELLARCLDSLVHHTSGLAWEVVIVDNASQDGTQQIVKQRFPHFKLLENELNVGFAAANNAGIKASRGRYVFLINSDTEIRANIPLAVVGFLDAHPKAGAVGCRLIDARGNSQAYAYGRDPTLAHLLGRNLARLVPARQSSAKGVRLVDWVSGAALAARREALEEVGLLDEGMHMYFEDVDLCLRLRQSGWEVWLDPDLEVVHFGGGTPVASHQRRGLYYESLRYFYGKHYGATRTHLLSLLLLINAARQRIGLS